jgi:hypothetical protein
MSGSRIRNASPSRFDALVVMSAGVQAAEIQRDIDRARSESQRLQRRKLELHARTLGRRVYAEASVLLGQRRGVGRSDVALSMLRESKACDLW